MKSCENKVYIETFGCQMNVSDSERVKTNLLEHGYQIVDSEAASDVVLINTCSVREKAEQKIYHRIGRIRRARRGGQQPLIGVMGCVAQLEGETLLGSERQIDFVVGTKANGRIAEIIEARRASQKPVADLGGRAADYQWTVAPDQRNSPYIAFVPIIEGCNKFCTYCIVPFSRGREQSRPAPEILSEILLLRDQGVREIHLIGQNVNSYRPQTTAGLENFRGATPFVKLLRAVAGTGIERIKFTTSFPRDFHADIIAALEEHENLCNWIHLPVQSGSNRILKLMRRGHLIESYRRHIAAIKASTRQIAVTSDLIVGFPGETSEDFEQTKNLVKDCEFGGLYIFKYSERPGTPAAAMLPDNLSEDTKQNRFIELEQVQRKIQKRIFDNHVGRVLNVLAEKVSQKNKSDLSGHSTCHKVINFTAPETWLGKSLKVKIVEAKLNSLYGTVVN